MKITFVTVNFEVSARTKRALLRVGLPVAVILGAGGIAYASLPHTFTSGEVLTAANLNNNFQSLDSRLTSIEGRASETNGSRLTARYTTTTYAGADGAQQVTRGFAGWFDTQRSEMCDVAVAADGQQRCLPASLNSSAVVFSDGACTKHVVHVALDPVCASTPTCSDCNPPAPKYYAIPVSACGVSSGVHLFPVGQPVSLMYYYIKSSTGACGIYYPTSTDRFYDASGAEIPASTFAAFTVTTQTQ